MTEDKLGDKLRAAHALEHAEAKQAADASFTSDIEKMNSKLAQSAWTFHCALKTQGFSDESADRLTSTYLSTMLVTTMTKAKKL